MKDVSAAGQEAQRRKAPEAGNVELPLSTNCLVPFSQSRAANSPTYVVAHCQLG